MIGSEYFFTPSNLITFRKFGEKEAFKRNMGYTIKEFYTKFDAFLANMGDRYRIPNYDWSKQFSPVPIIKKQVILNLIKMTGDRMTFFLTYCLWSNLRANWHSKRTSGIKPAS